MARMDTGVEDVEPTIWGSMLTVAGQVVLRAPHLAGRKASLDTVFMQLRDQTISKRHIAETCARYGARWQRASPLRGGLTGERAISNGGPGVLVGKTGAGLLGWPTSQARVVSIPSRTPR